MKKESAIYSYAKYLQTENAKCILALENWFSQDRDSDYVEYLKSFNNFLRIIKKDEKSTSILSERLVESLKKEANKKITTTYQRLHSDFLNRAKVNFKKNNILTEIVNKTTPKLDDYSFDIQYIKLLRQIEEEIGNN